MKTRNLILFLFLSIFMLTPISQELEAKKTSSSSSISFTNPRLDHNQYVDGNKVMYVRFGMRIDGMQGRRLKWTVSLFKKNGNPLYTNEGKKEVQSVVFSPAYPSTVYNSEYAWFSYSHMKLPQGRTYCYALIKVYDDATGRLLKTSPMLDFWVDRN